MAEVVEEKKEKLLLTRDENGYIFHFDVRKKTWHYKVTKLIKETWQDRDNKIATIIRAWIKEGLDYEQLPKELQKLVPDLKPKQ